MPARDGESPFKGLWTDARDAHASLAARASSGLLSPSLEGKVRQFIDEGFCVIEQAVPADVCSQLVGRLADAWTRGNDQMLTQYPDSQKCLPVRPGIAADRMRVVDLHVVDDLARQALFADQIVAFLMAVFEEEPLLFQSLTFERGSQQGFHQDTAYVVVSEPRQLAASWIALEDVSPGSGELMYIPGSHRIPERLFSGIYKHWKPDRDGHEEHDRWARHIVQASQDMRLPVAKFLPKRGDVLIWAADLVHGGSPVEKQGSTRRSLVGHYCPASVRPNYFDFAPKRAKTKKAHNGVGSWASYHYEKW